MQLAFQNGQMRLIDNINSLLGEDLKGTLKPGSKLKIAASCFSISSAVCRPQALRAVFRDPGFASDSVKQRRAGVQALRRLLKSRH